jgi:hypothetical protein
LADSTALIVGAVLAVRHAGLTPDVVALMGALREMTDAIHSGYLDREVVAAAQAMLGLTERLARRYLDRLRSPAEGLVASGMIEEDALRSVLALRERYVGLPASADQMIADVVVSDHYTSDVATPLPPLLS